MPVLNGWHLILGIAGGILGAAAGAFPAFMLCGLSCIIGTVILFITGDPSFNLTVTWGPLIGPHTAFAGGIAAAAYAAHKGQLDSGRNIVKPLFPLKSLSVYCIGAIFGFVGIVLVWIFSLVPAIKGISWINPIALSITVNGMFTRLIIGKTGLLGCRKSNQSIWIPCPEENSLPWHMRPIKLMGFSFVVALPVAYLAVMLPEISGLLFGLAAISLVLLVLGHKIPVVLHIILSAQLVAASTGNLWWGVVFGLGSAIVAERSACLFLDRGDTHVDPAAMAIAVTHSLFVLFLYIGVFHLDYYVALPAVVLVLAGGYLILSGLKKSHD
ncbi:hypothetical protein ACFL4L_03065 [bacterium]